MFNEKDQKAGPVVAFDYIANLGEGRQIVLRAHFGRDDHCVVQNDILDRIVSIGDRQKARYEIVDLAADLLKHEKTLRQLLEDRENVRVNHKHTIAKLNVEAETLATTEKDTFDAAYNAFVKEGRRGNFEPKGHKKTELERIKFAQTKVKEDIVKAEAEALVVEKNMEISITRHTQEIEKLKIEIEKRKGIIGERNPDT